MLTCKKCLSSLGRTADHARVAVEKKLDGINTMMARPISDFDEAANILENACKFVLMHC